MRSAPTGSASPLARANSKLPNSADAATSVWLNSGSRASLREPPPRRCLPPHCCRFPPRTPYRCTAVVSAAFSSPTGQMGAATASRRIRVRSAIYRRPIKAMTTSAILRSIHYFRAVRWHSDRPQYWACPAIRIAGRYRRVSRRQRAGQASRYRTDARATVAAA